MINTNVTMTGADTGYSRINLTMSGSDSTPVTATGTAVTSYDGTTVSGGSTDAVYGASSIAGVSFSGVSTLDIANADLGLTSSQYSAFTTLTTEGTGSIDLTSTVGAVAWLAVGIPFAIGLYIALQKAAALL